MGKGYFGWLGVRGHFYGRWECLEVYFGWMGLCGHLFVSWQGCVEVYSGWLGVSGDIFCVRGCWS